ncbi:MAG: tetratricopeptide repeat protein, partial [Micromonosporaceae bacterium]
TLGLQGGEDEIRLASTLVGSYWLRGDFVRAEILAQQVIHRAEGHGSRRSRGSAYWNASLVAEARGRLPLAIEFAERALALFADDTDDRNIARLRVDYAWLLLRKNPPEVTRAEQLLTSAQETLESLNLHLDLAYCRTELARCLLHLNKVDDALRAAESAVSTLAPKHIIETARAHLVLAYARHLSGDTDAAIEAVEQAYAQLDEPNQGWQALSLWRELADLFEHLDSADRAAAAYRRLADAAGAHSVPSPLNVSTSDGGQAPRPDERSNAAQVGSAR